MGKETIHSYNKDLTLMRALFKSLTRFLRRVSFDVYMYNSVFS